MRLDANGKGQGKMTLATKVNAFGDTIELENYDLAPVQLSNITRQQEVARAVPRGTPLLPLFDSGETVLADDARGRIVYTPDFVAAPRRAGLVRRAARRRSSGRPSAARCTTARSTSRG